MWAFLVIATEAQGEGSHESHELLWLQVCLLSQSIDNKTASVCLWTVLDDISLCANVLSTHVENHGWATAVLHRSVASQLDQIRGAEHGRDMVTRVGDLLDLLDSEAELLALSNGELILQRDRSRSAPKAQEEARLYSLCKLCGDDVFMSLLERNKEHTHKSLYRHVMP